MLSGVEFGLHALGVGAGAERTVIDAVAAAAERTGFATLWAGDGPQATGVALDAADITWLDPFVALSFAAAATNTIELATAIQPLPERNPAVVAKQADSLNRLSGGRLLLGLEIQGAGPEATGDRRNFRAGNYADAMRELWDAEAAAGNAGLRMHPPRRRAPVLFGGVDDRDLRRVVTCGDGWYGFALGDVEEAARCTSTLRRMCRRAGREFGDLRLVVSLRDPEPDDATRLADVGVDQQVLITTPPADPIAAESWVADLARRWLGART